MNSRSKKSKNTGYKNFKKGRQTDPDKDGSKDDIIVSVEKNVVSNARQKIKQGKEKKLVDTYGEAGLEEYLVGSSFQSLLFEKDSMDEKLRNVIHHDITSYNELICKYYKKSSDKGNPIGQFAMALVLIQGQHGQSKDELEGVQMMVKSAKKGCGPALFNHGTWLMEGVKGLEKNPLKAHKMFTKAKKDPALDDFEDQHFGTLYSLAKMRMSGEGNVKSYSAALKHLREADKVSPGKMDPELISMCETMVEISGVEHQRECDSRYRRLKVVARHMQYQPLSEWVDLYSFYGFGMSKQPSVEDSQVCMLQGDFVEWMSRVGASQVLLDEFPAMGEPLPPLECERPGCDVTEETSDKSLKKCTECQAPYCSISCQRADWSRHRPVCEAVAGGINSELTDHDLEMLQKMGITEINGKELVADRQCTHEENSIPCGPECMKERGASSMVQHQYTNVTKNLTQKHLQLARAAGINLPDNADIQEIDPENQNDGSSVAAPVTNAGHLEDFDDDDEPEVKNKSKALRKQLNMKERNPDVDYVVFTPSGEMNDYGITLTNIMGKVFFQVLWTRVISVPWKHPALKGKTFWMVYDTLQASLPNDKYRKMLRNQLQAEFGVDPVEAKLAAGL